MYEREKDFCRRNEERLQKAIPSPRLLCFLSVVPCFVSDTHKWFTPKVSGMVPGARDGHSACVLAKSMFIFGGYEQLVSSL